MADSATHRTPPSPEPCGCPRRATSGTMTGHGGRDGNPAGAQIRQGWLARQLSLPADAEEVVDAFVGDARALAKL